ncbi:iron-dicitrate ABC transporter permease FecC [Candidatus Pseudomonas adelgestsugas]|uniref:Fe(3+) dicitrate transport system permease protein FecC n=1 Tax=Candidatus Pseudomonas adelgestsugas TaxID=1302376 RepID=A0ABX5R9B6_9PSED|nr:iron-dicitrate ABC transporter permease FecC [Candidatus Pseudomonas adelgestsugas]QAX81944.1 Fe(3+) dicitrate transport system permease protein FecC [Candidatus Pseudomonas adelgestsugas]
MQRSFAAAGILLLGAILFWFSLYSWSPFVITPTDAWNGLVHQGVAAGNMAYIVTLLRVPRAVCAALVGACLGLAGTLMQGITRNRMASPSLLGVTAGAALGLALFSTGLVVPPFAGGTLLMTCLGGALAWVTVFSLSRAWSPTTAQGRLVLAGMAVAALCVALTRLTVILVEVQAQSVLNWLAGSLANVNTAHVQLLWPCTLIGGLWALWCAPRLNLINLGDDTARSLGVSIGSLRLQVFIASLLLVGASVCVVGPIGFVGLIAPNIIRQFLGNDYCWLIPLSAALGAVIVLGADLLSRAMAFPAETSAGVVTALIGAPFFLFLARRAL